MKTKRIIFLDIHGVLVGKNKEIIESSCGHIRSIINLTGARVVITSSMRKYATHEDILKHIPVGISEHVIGYTPVINYTASSGVKFNVPKGTEIRQWLLDNKGILGCKYSKFKTYAVVDDNTDFLYEHYGNCVICESGVGVTRLKKLEIMKLLEA